MTDDVALSVENGVARLTMTSGKVNAIANELVDALTAEVDACQALAEKGELKAVVLASGREKFFSPGFHLKKLMGYGPAGMNAFGRNYTSLCLKLLSLPVYTVAEIGGHCIAGGMILALCCDERICGADDEARLGLNEVRIGLPLPMPAIALARHRLPERAAFEAVMLAATYDPAGAEKLGFLDQRVSPDKLARAVADRIGAWIESAGKAFRLTKERVNLELITAFREAADAMPETFDTVLNDPELQQQLMAAMMAKG